ncbi:MAG: hypothetical protein ACK8QZ_10295, partial [Anaerolineales bacterium]
MLRFAAQVKRKPLARLELMMSMNSLTIAGIFFVCLLFLEWLFWLSPLKHVGELLSNKMGAWFYVLQPHYIIRVLTL